MYKTEDSNSFFVWKLQEIQDSYKERESRISFPNVACLNMTFRPTKWLQVICNIWMSIFFIFLVDLRHPLSIFEFRFRFHRSITESAFNWGIGRLLGGSFSLFSGVGTNSQIPCVLIGPFQNKFSFKLGDRRLLKGEITNHRQQGASFPYPLCANMHDVSISQQIQP